MLLLFTPVDSHWRECVAAAKKLGKRERVFEDDVFIENMHLVSGSKRVDVVLSMSCGSPGQWFPETEYVSVRHLCFGNKWHTAQNNL